MWCSTRISARPFPFLVYIIGIDNACTETSSTRFAVDTRGIKAARRTAFLVLEDVKVMTRWFDANKLTTNVDKFEAILFERCLPDEVQTKTTNYITNPVVNI